MAGPRQSVPARRDPLELAEGLYLSCAAAALHRLGIFETLSAPISAEAAARSTGVDPELLAGTLEYLARRTDLVRREGAGYRTGEGFDAHARFVLSLYGGAYAPVAVGLAHLLRRPTGGAALVDRAAQALAFRRIEPGRAGALPAILRQLELTGILDLGCGSGDTLVALAAADPSLACWGVDSNPAMCRAARLKLREAGLSRRVRILLGDAAQPAQCVPLEIRRKVKTVVTENFANELFRGGGRSFTAWLKRLRRALPGRILVISDYYGRLRMDAPDSDPATLLHDFCQLISGQGIPPGDHRGWESHYRDAGWRLVSSIDDRKTTRFIHIVAANEARKPVSPRPRRRSGSEIEMAI